MNAGKKTIAVGGAGAMLAATLLGLPSAAGATPTNVPKVVIHANKHVRLSHRHIHSGRVQFHIVTGKGTQDMQLARLHKGYTIADAGRDINAGFEGSASAISRADKNVTFLGGGEGKPGKPGDFGTTLAAGKYLVINFNNQAYTSLIVTGKEPTQPSFPTSATVKLLSYGFSTPSTLPRAASIHLTDGADQPHFLVMQRVKPGTTHAQVKKSFESNGEPNFVLKGSTQSGVLSPGRSEAFSYDLPAGRYVLACFWPDDKTGMVHAAMGMFKLVTLT
jgi:hypothetical protein